MYMFLPNKNILDHNVELSTHCLQDGSVLLCLLSIFKLQTFCSIGKNKKKLKIDLLLRAVE